MPMLQIDGSAIAEIDQGKATELLDAAAVGIGQVRWPAGFPPSVGMDVPKLEGWTFSINLTVDFPEPQSIGEQW